MAESKIENWKHSEESFIDCFEDKTRIQLDYIRALGELQLNSEKQDYMPNTLEIKNRINDFENRGGTTTRTVDRKAERFQKQGYVLFSKDGKHGSKNKHKLTEKGKELYNKIAPFYSEISFKIQIAQTIQDIVKDKEIDEVCEGRLVNRVRASERDDLKHLVEMRLCKITENELIQGLKIYEEIRKAWYDKEPAENEDFNYDEIIESSKSED